MRIKFLFSFCILFQSLLYSSSFNDLLNYSLDLIQKNKYFYYKKGTEIFVCYDAVKEANKLFNRSESDENKAISDCCNYIKKGINELNE